MLEGWALSRLDPSNASTDVSAPGGAPTVRRDPERLRMRTIASVGLTMCSPLQTSGTKMGEIWIVLTA